MKFFRIILIICAAIIHVYGQNISLMNLKGNLHATYLNPALKVDKKLNISLPGVHVLIGADGYSVNQLTSKNNSGARYIDLNVSEKIKHDQNLFFRNEIHTIDLSYGLSDWVFMAGHAFKSEGNLSIPRDLLSVISNGNAAYIGQKLSIGPQININAYNEFYGGIQKDFGQVSIGAKAKLIYGVSNLYTEKGVINFTTDNEFYQLNFETNYIARSSSLLDYYSLDSIKVNYNVLSFDNLFYNNMGMAFDFGVTIQLNESVLVSASVLDIGKINWDYSPRKFVSKGNFKFDGIDIVDYIGDSTSISIKDTLLDILDVTQGIEKYSTLLNGIYTLGLQFNYQNDWTFNSLLVFADNFNAHQTSVAFSAKRKFSIFELGVQYRLSKNNFTALGLFGKLRLGPFSIFASSENIIGLIKPFDSKSASIRLGSALQF